MGQTAHSGTSLLKDMNPSAVTHPIHQYLMSLVQKYISKQIMVRELQCMLKELRPQLFYENPGGDYYIHDIIIDNTSFISAEMMDQVAMSHGLAMGLQHIFD